MSAQRSSALFLLRKFCSVANLKLKCLAWQVCLIFLFDLIGFSKIYVIAFFKIFLDALEIFLKTPLYKEYARLRTPLAYSEQ